MIQPIKHKFYIQKHPIYGESFGEQELFEKFNAWYVSFEGLLESGDIMNIATEEFAESPRLRLYIPKQSEIAHKSTDVTLTLLWKSDKDFTVQDEEQSFYEYIKGTLLEYHDTFRRGRYWELILIKAPKLVAERLYEGNQYREVSYIFKNIYGHYFTESQIGKVKTSDFRTPDSFDDSFMLLESGQNISYEE